MTRSYSPLLFWLGMTIAASLMLYHTSDRVNELDRQLRELDAQIEDEQISLHVLKAEWVYLSNPARIEAESKRHLGLQPTAPQRIAALQNISDLLPVFTPSEAGPTVVFAKADVSGVAPSAKPEAKPPLQTASVSAPKRTAPDTSSKHDRVLASLNAGRINDHMIMQHTAVLEGSTDRIGTLISTLGLHP